MIVWIILGVIYTVASYWLFFYASNHDAKLKGTDWKDEITPAHFFAPLFAPVLLINIVAVKRYFEGDE